MKRRHWTHALRDSRHRLRLELRSLPSCMDPSWSSWHDQQAQQINIALCRISSALIREHSKCESPAWADWNKRCAQTQSRLNVHIRELANMRRAAAELHHLRETATYTSAGRIDRVLMEIAVTFGGRSAKQVAA